MLVWALIKREPESQDRNGLGTDLVDPEEVWLQSAVYLETPM